MSNELKIDPVWFDGNTYRPDADEVRLLSQLQLVWRLMADGKWRTLNEIHKAIGHKGSEAGISARLRDFRKERCGKHEVQRRECGRYGSGVWEYRVIPVAQVPEGEQYELRA